MAERSWGLFPTDRIRIGTRVYTRSFVVVQFGMLRSESRIIVKRCEGDAIDTISDAVEWMVLHTLSECRPVGDHWYIEAL